MKIRGWVYVIANEAMPGLVKVGYSTKDPHLRALELSSTGTPLPFTVQYDALVFAPREVEQQVHRAMSGYSTGKEWFRCTWQEAMAFIRDISAEYLITEHLHCPEAPNAPSEPLGSKEPEPAASTSFKYEPIESDEPVKLPGMPAPMM